MAVDKQRGRFLIPPAYTGVQTLEKRSPDCLFCHFSGPPARPEGGKAGSATRCRIMRSDMTSARQAVQKPTGYGCTETATPNSADCSLFQPQHASCTMPGPAAKQRGNPLAGMGSGLESSKRPVTTFHCGVFDLELLAGHSNPAYRSSAREPACRASS